MQEAGFAWPAAAVLPWLAIGGLAWLMSGCAGVAGLSAVSAGYGQPYYVPYQPTYEAPRQLHCSSYDYGYGVAGMDCF